jgi:hypothetical protein
MVSKSSAIAPIRPTQQTDELWGVDGSTYYYNGVGRGNCSAGEVWNSEKRKCVTSMQTLVTTPDTTPAPTSGGVRSDRGLKPVIVSIDGVQHAYQTPANPKGLVVFFHGCSRSIYGGWPPSANPKFWGMPEDVGRTKQCLRAGYAILYVGPQNSKTGCFSAKDGKDPQTAEKVIQQVRKITRTSEKPLYLGGCSAGGGMIYRLVGEGKIKCDGMFAESATKAEPTAKTPASLWIVLATDKELAAGQEMVRIATQKKTPADVLISPKRKITPGFFADQFASISEANSAKIAASLTKSKVIDASGNIVADIKNKKNWYATLGKEVKIPETQLPFWNSGIVQAMMTAEGKHEAVSMFMTVFLKWAESDFKDDINALAKKYAVTKPAYVLA